MSPPPPAAGHSNDPAVKAANEKRFGILKRSVAVSLPWVGDVRKRFTDFIVHEIRKDGAVVHLTDYEEVDGPSDQASFNGHGRNSMNRTASSSSAVTTNSTQNAANNNGQTARKISDRDREKLISMVGKASTKALEDADEKMQLRQTMPNNERFVVFPAIHDRAQRTVVHQEIRRMFDSRVLTTTDKSDVITAEATRQPSNRGRSNQNMTGQRPTQQGGQRRNLNNWNRELGFEALGGEYLHFTLYKENRDTMDAINQIGRMLRIKSPAFGFAGTKDRRASTLQRISVRRQRAKNLIWLNTRLTGLKVGDFKHSQYPIQLGHLTGNEFHITIKNCEPLTSGNYSLERRIQTLQHNVEVGLWYIKTHGYINYFGIQRFGTYSIPTHRHGMKILQGDFEGVVRDVLHIEEHLVDQLLNNNGHNARPGSRSGEHNTEDDLARARAIMTWNATKNSAAALAHMPKRFNSETSIIEFLGRPGQATNYQQALLTITRGLRMMYIHAYQSFVWNHVASERWSRYGPRVVVGDLVIVPDQNPFGEDEVEANIDEEEFYTQARPLTQEDIDSGKYTIFDVVLPQPGFDVIYPKNDIGHFYTSFMGTPENGGLNPFDMRRKEKEFSLSGNYRHLMGRFLDEPQYAIRVYRDDTDQLYPTEMDFITQKRADEQAKGDAANKKLAQERAGTAEQWGTFTNNALFFDMEMAKERRRKAEEAPATDNVRLNETWVQTGVDADSKRVKITKHEFQTELKQEHSPISVATDDKSIASKLKEQEALVNSSTTAAETSTTDLSMSSLMKPALSENTPMALSENKVMGLSEMKPMTLSECMPALSELLMNLYHNQRDTSATATVDSSEKSTGKGLSDFFFDSGGTHTDFKSWYNARTPIDTAKIGKQTEAKPELVAADKKIVSGVLLPTYRTVSRSLLEDPASFVPMTVKDADDSNCGGEKIAVLFKFQLRSSNYATVVIRELMHSEPGSPSQFNKGLAATY